MSYLSRFNRSSRVLIFLSLFVLSCCSRQGQLTGEVFIVTKGGQSLRLGLVEVRAIPEDVIQPFVQAKHAAAKEEMDKLQRLWDEALAKAKLTQANLEEATTRYIQASKRLASEYTSAAWELYTSAGRELEEVKHAALEMSNDLHAITEKRDYWKSAGYYLENLPTTTITTKTDADGKFTLSLDKKKRYAIAAQATREILSTTEKYSWFIWVSLEGNNIKHIMLNNDNLGVQHPDAVVNY
jgi:hypothetical protein